MLATPMNSASNESINREMAQIKVMIAQTVAKREALKMEMADWYVRFPGEKFAKFKDLIVTDSVLSELDSNYKRLWDFSNIQSNIA